MNLTNPSSFSPFRYFSSELAILNRLIDAALIWGCLELPRSLLEVKPGYLYQIAAALAILVYYLAAEIKGIYHSSRLHSYDSMIGNIFVSWLWTGLILVLIGFSTKSSADYSRLAIGFWLALTPLALIAERFMTFLLLRWLRKNGRNSRSFAILGDKESNQRLLETMNSAPWIGLSHFGTYENVETLLTKMRSNQVDYIFIAYPIARQNEIITAVNTLSDTTASIYLSPDAFLSDLLASKAVMLGNSTIIAINDHPFHGTPKLLKKIEDMILGSLFFLLTLPLMALISIGIKLTSKGPIIFKQRRYGLNGEVIEVLKFRTMNVQEDGDQVIQAKKNDLRITSLGRFLRKTSLDELPQFMNVLNGTMSLVGPRPHAISHNEHYRKLIHGYMQRHKVKPGITGWAQVNGFRGETDTLDKMQSRVEYDLYYINHWSIWFDVKIIFLTFLQGFINKSAY